MSLFYLFYTKYFSLMMTFKRPKRVVAAINTYTLTYVGCYLHNYGAVSLNRKIQSTVEGNVRAPRLGRS